jgi:hypothetical protein
MKRLLLLAFLAWAAPAQAVVPFTQVGDAAYSITNTDTYVTTSTAFTSGRTWTLPYASATCIGQTCAPAANQLVIVDGAKTLTSTNTLTIAPQAGNTINGNAANLILSAPGVRVVLIPTSSTNWQAVVSGDYRSSSVAAASAVALTTGTAANITSIALSQGEWSCSANTARTLAASTSVTVLRSSISATSATSGLNGSFGTQVSTAANVMGATASVIIPPIRLVLTATTTYYLVAEDTFTVSTNAAYGTITCQRM